MLREAVQSAIAQTYRPIEIVIVDDGSTDDTPQAIAELEARHGGEIRAVRRANGGPGAARETGRLAARGEFVQYLDSDDLLLPHKFALQTRALNDDPAAGVAYGRTRYRDAGGAEIACDWKPLLDHQLSIFPYFLLGRLWETVSPLYRASVLDAAGPWTPRRLEEDWEYDCRVGSLGVRLAFTPDVVAEHRAHASERLSRGPALDPGRLRDRAAAHEAIYGHALAAGVSTAAAEMQHFARSLFLLARQCGAAALPAESERLFALARAASGDGSARLQFRIYSAVARVIGWSAAGKLATMTDRWRSSPS